ncbi:MAG: DNA polymerase III subunit delta [Acidimicrobiales bacterium]
MSVRLIKGDDPSLVSQAVQTALTELVGDADRTLMVEELTEANYAPDDAEPDLTALVTAAHTPPFLTERRVVVGRHLARFSRKEQVLGLVDYLDDPAPTTDLVLVWEKAPGSNTKMSAVPKALKDALKKVGALEVDAAPKGKGRRMLLEAKLAEAPIRFEAGARKRLTDVVGDDVGRVDAIVAALVSTFGDGAAVSANDVEPFLGQASDVPPWELTDAIDSGDINLALERMHRMTRAGDRHGLALLATLHNHYQRALALDGAGAADEKAAAAHLGMTGSTFPAKKALTLSRRLGSARIRQAITLLAAADLDLRGNSAIPGEALLEVLVARLARLSR